MNKIFYYLLFLIFGIIITTIILFIIPTLIAIIISLFLYFLFYFKPLYLKNYCINFFRLDIKYKNFINFLYGCYFAILFFFTSLLILNYFISVYKKDDFLYFIFFASLLLCLTYLPQIFNKIFKKHNPSIRLYLYLTLTLYLILAYYPHITGLTADYSKFINDIWLVIAFDTLIVLIIEKYKNFKVNKDMI